MNQSELKKFLEEYKQGKIDDSKIIDKLLKNPYEDIGYAKLDMHRDLRKGFPETVFCPGKTTEQIVSILKRLDKNSSTILATKAEKEVFNAVKNEMKNAEYNESAKMIILQKEKPVLKGRVAIITAGTGDIPIAEEAACVCEAMGSLAERNFDVGVAGIHRLFSNLEKINKANVIIAIAGMEGALPSVISGLTDKPIIAVPTSIGYGANFNGLAPLLSMLNTCSPGVAVVNIDNGFGAGYIASIINLAIVNGGK